MKKFREENSIYNWCKRNNQEYLIDEWDYKRNGSKNLKNVSYGSNTKYWWVCSKGHSYQATAYLRTIYKSQCPICKNMQVLKGYNDFASKCPHLLKEWDYEKNSFKPDEIYYRSHKKVWWKCKNGHSWSTELYYRDANNSRCPYCTNKKVDTGFNDVGTLYPVIKIFWDYEKNKKKPEDFPGLYSNSKAYFICEHGHSWRTSISDFTHGTRCPVCANKKIIKGINDLFTTCSVLKSEWDFDKNIIDPYTVSSGSNKKVWWKCEKGHSWQATINSRVKGNSCPICSKETQSSLPEKAIFYYVKQIFIDAKENIKLKELKNRELDIYIPSIKVGIEYDGVNWHKMVKRDLEKDALCRNNDIILIRFREKGCPIYFSNSIKIECERIHSNILLLSDPIKLLFVELGKLINKKLNIEIDLERDLTPINELLVSYKKDLSLEKLSPKLVKEWNCEKNGSLTPDMFSNSSNKKVWWKCDKGHEWQAIIGSRTGVHHHNGCPYCSGHKVMKGFNDLESQYPEVANEWDYEKNGNLKPSEITALNNKKVWWICKHGHSYCAVIRSRTKAKSGCPICAGQKPEKGKTDLATLYPGLVKEWDYEKNGDLKPSDLLPGSEVRVWWKCPKGHSYQTIPAVRTKKHTGCPVCCNLKVIQGVNDFETLQPKLIVDWDYDNNEKLPSEISGGGGSHYKAGWKCHVCGYKWKATVASRVRLGCGCPECARRKQKNKNN